MMDQSEIQSNSQVIFITLLSAFAQRTGAFTNHSKLYNYAEPQLFSWGKPAYFDFSSCNFNVRDHILNTAGDGLITWESKLDNTGSKF